MVWLTVLKRHTRTKDWKDSGKEPIQTFWEALEALCASSCTMSSEKSVPKGNSDEAGANKEGSFIFIILDYPNLLILSRDY